MTLERHIILTLGRSGSNTLREMLNQHPEVLNFGEVLGEWNGIRKMQRRLGLYRSSDARFLDAVLSPRFFRAANAVRTLRKRRSGDGGQAKPFAQIRTIGIKDFSLNFDRYGLGDYLAARPDIRVIGLTRPGVVERTISFLMLRQTGVVERSSQGGPRAPASIRVAPDELRTQLEEVEAENQRLDEMLSTLEPHRVHRVTYRGLFDGTETRARTMEGLFAFLGLAPCPVAPARGKIIDRPLSETIVNFEECCAVLAGTRFEAMLLEADKAGAAKGGS